MPARKITVRRAARACAELRPALRRVAAAAGRARRLRRTSRAINADLVTGKQQFVAKCGSCHALARAGTKGTSAPTSTTPSAQSLKDGFKRVDRRGAIVTEQILPQPQA